MHGGKTQIDKELQATGVKPKRINGLRVTDKDMIELMQEVYPKVAENLGKALEKHEIQSVVLAGHEGLLRARLDPSQPELQLVGEVEAVDGPRLLEVLKKDQVAVVSPLGLAADKKVYSTSTPIMLRPQLRGKCMRMLCFC